MLSETADFLYKCTDYFDAGDDGGVIWNDPDIGIEWGVQAPVLSDKDQKYPRLKDLPREKLPAPYAP